MPDATVETEVTVYVVERGLYSSRYVEGVYSSLAEAKNGWAHDPPGTGEVKWNRDHTWWTRTDPDGWTENGPAGTSSGEWTNGLDFNDATDITPHTLKIKVPAAAD